MMMLGPSLSLTALLLLLLLATLLAANDDELRRGIGIRGMLTDDVLLSIGGMYVSDWDNSSPRLRPV